MAHLVAPINIDGTLRCCQPATKRTEAVLSGDATALAANQWEVFRAATGETKEGSVKFGVCCASEIVLTLLGQVETLDSGYDWVRVLHNGVEVFYHQSADTSDDEEETVSAGPFTVTLTLEDRPCGHIVEISGATGDAEANNDVWWQVTAAVT